MLPHPSNVSLCMPQRLLVVAAEGDESQDRCQALASRHHQRMERRSAAGVAFHEPGRSQPSAVRTHSSVAAGLGTAVVEPSAWHDVSAPTNNNETPMTKRMWGIGATIGRVGRIERWGEEVEKSQRRPRVPKLVHENARQMPRTGARRRTGGQEPLTAPRFATKRAFLGRPAADRPRGEMATRRDSYVAANQLSISRSWSRWRLRTARYSLRGLRHRCAWIGFPHWRC